MLRFNLFFLSTIYRVWSLPILLSSLLAFLDGFPSSFGLLLVEQQMEQLGEEEDDALDLNPSYGGIQTGDGE